MSHSVSEHLGIDLGEYDSLIRRYIRAYDEMLDSAVDAVLGSGMLERVLDLGAGTGALAEKLLERHPTCTVELWDVDPQMIQRAQARLERFGQRVRVREASFFEVDGTADAAMASLSLHHVHDLGEKAALYREFYSALRSGGTLAIADITISTDLEDAQAEWEIWANHQVAQGFTKEQAWRHFDDWAQEDRYFSQNQELSALQEAGFDADTFWRAEPSTVLVGARP